MTKEVSYTNPQICLLPNEVMKNDLPNINKALSKAFTIKHNLPTYKELN